MYWNLGLDSAILGKKTFPFYSRKTVFWVSDRTKENVYGKKEKRK